MAVAPFQLIPAMGLSFILIAVIIVCANCICYGGPLFRVQFFIDGMSIDTRSFLPGPGNGKYYRNVDHVVPAEGKHPVEIMKANSTGMHTEVKSLQARNPGEV